MSKLIGRLAKKIEEDLDIKVDPDTFISIRPRSWYKSAGAWSWSMEVSGSSTRKVGSIYTATDCARSHVKLFRVDQHPGYCWDQDIEVVPEKIPTNPTLEP